MLSLGVLMINLYASCLHLIDTFRKWAQCWLHYTSVWQLTKCSSLGTGIYRALRFIIRMILTYVG